MGDRSLAHIEKVITTYPIEGADNVEMVQVLDFHVLTKKGQFKSGDLVVYIEVDSILPDGLSEEDNKLIKQKKTDLKNASGEDIVSIENEMKDILLRNTKPEFEFLRKDKFTIKAKKYNKLGIISMGIIFPLDILPKNIKLKEGLDVTDILGIKKVIEDAEEDSKLTSSQNSLQKLMMKFKWYRKIYFFFNKKEELKGVWQDFFPGKSDEENAQKLYSKMLEKYGDQTFYVAEKMEGQNISSFLYGKKKKIFGVCSRTNYYKTDDSSNKFWRAVRINGHDNKLKNLNKNLFIRGEHCAPGVQGNIYKFDDSRIFLFEVYDIDNKKLYNYDEFISFCKENEFETCPIIDDNFKLPATVQEILDYSNGPSVHNPKQLREGIVIRLKSNPKVSFKVRSPEYLVKKK